MNGRLFENLPRLSRIWLDGNECIDEYIQGDAPIKSAPARIDRQCGFVETTETGISCETIGEGRYRKCCFLKETTQITTANDSFTGARDHSVQEINFAYNKKIFFLPIRVSDKFPELRAYDAHQCSLTTISKQNFEKMENLKYLSLEGNQITTIFSETFEDLVKLNYLSIRKSAVHQCNQGLQNQCWHAPAKMAADTGKKSIILINYIFQEATK